MELISERHGDILVIDAWQRIDGTNARSFEEALRNATTGDERAVVIDLDQLTYISSAGLRVMLIAARQLKQQNAEFALCNLSGPVRSVFEISGFDRIIPIHASKDGALASVAG